MKTCLFYRYLKVQSLIINPIKKGQYEFYIATSEYKTY